MIISIASGKGGTGKTTVAVSLALSLDKSAQFLDCDVEEPNAHIFLKPKIKDKKIVSIPVPKIDESRCDYCGRCAKVCAYNAIAVLKNNVLTFPQLCHGCGGCSLLCPKGAITEVGREIGLLEIGTVSGFQFVHGRLNIGEAMSTPLIRAVKEYINPVRNIKGAHDDSEISNGVNPNKTVIIDAPPGTSCPVVEAVKGSDFCILVTEPTPFGLNDLILAVEMLKKLNIPFGVIINRCGIGNDAVDSYCSKNEVDVLMRIPFDRDIAVLYSKGVPIVQGKEEYSRKFKKLISNIQLEKI